jgi:parvulin-like peptidyl-prolyl isomerase
VNRLVLALGGCVAALSLAATGCSSDVRDAATVNGSGIDRRTFEDDLQAYIDNVEYQTALSSQGGGPSVIGPGGTGTATMEFADSRLRLDILYELVRQEVDKQGIEVTDEMRQQAPAAAMANTLNFVPEQLRDQIWSAFPASFRDRAAEDAAYLLALQDHLGGNLTDEELQAIYNEDPAKFGLLCARHILVPTKEQADQLRAELDGGADFAEVAAQNGTDASAQEGGRLYQEGQDCPAASTFVPEFVEGALSVPTGEVAGPVQTQFGWHLILVDKAEEKPFSEVKDAVQQSAATQANSALNDVLAEAAKSDITVDPKYGTWDPATANIVAPGKPLPTTTVAG